MLMFLCPIVTKIVSYYVTLIFYTDAPPHNHGVHAVHKTLFFFLNISYAHLIITKEFRRE